MKILKIAIEENRFCNPENRRTNRKKPRNILYISDRENVYPFYRGSPAYH
jgi:hypothetical protein